MNIGTLTIEMAANIARIQQDMDAARRVVDGTMGSIIKSASQAKAAIGGLAVGLTGAAFTGWIKGAIDTADETSKMAQKIGVATKDVAGLQLAFRQAGASDAFGSSMAKLAKSVEGGSQAFDAMGISTKASDGTMKSSRQLLGEVADKFASYEGSIKKSALAQEIFGKSGAELIPLLNAGAAGLDEYDAIAQKLGLTISTETAQAAEKFNDTMDLVGLGTKGVATGIAAELLPTLSGLAGQFLGTMTEGDRLKKTADFLSTALKGLYITGLGVIEIFSTVGTTVGGVAAVIVSALRGDFEGAAQTFRDLKSDIGTGWKDTAAQMSAAWSATSNASVDSMAATQAALKGAAPSVTDHAKSVKAVADEYAKLSAEIAKQLALSQAELDGNGKLEASEKYRITTLEKLIEQYQAGKITLDEYIDLEAKMNDVQGVMEKAEAQAKAAKAAQAAYAESLQYQDDLNKALRDEEDARNKIRMAVGANTVAAEEAQALAELETQSVFASAEDRKRILDYYRIELDLRKKIAAINSAGGIDQAERDRLIAIEAENAARLKGVADMGAAMQSTTSIWQSIDQTAHTVWTNVLQGGQDIWSKLRNTAKSVFFDWLYQMTLKKWIFSIGATVSGSGAMAQGAGSGGMSTISNLSSLAGAGMQYFGGASVGASSASLFAANATGAVGGDALGAMIAGNGGWAGVSATGSAAAGTAATGAGMMSTIGAAMPYIAAAAGVYMLAKSMEGGEKRSGATYTTGSKGEAVFNQGPSGGEIAADQSRGLFSSTQTEINRLLAGFGSKATVTGFTAGLESSKNGKGFQFAGGYIGDKAFGENLGRTGGQFSMQSQDDATALANYSTDLQRSVLEALQAADLGGSVGAWLSGLGDIEKLSKDQVATNLTQVTAYQQLQEASKSYPAALDNIKTMTVEASAKLLEVAGGLDGLQTALASYFDLFGTDAEKYDQAIKTVHAGFDAINVVMPASNANLREWYKGEVARLGAMDLGVEANAKAYAGALKLASGVDALAKAEEQAATTRQSWQDQLNVLTGKTTDTALQMQRDLASTTDESTQALIRAVYAEKDRQKAMSESATAMQKMATDQAAAAQKSADAYKSALSAQQSYYASLTSAGDAVRNLLAGLKTGVNAGTSPQSRLDAARAQYLQDLSAARGGDFAAYNRVATTAQTYIGAGSDMYASSAEQKAILAQVQSELQNLPAVSQYDANLAQLKAIEAAIKDGATNTVGAIQAQQFDTLAAINSMTATLSSSFGSIDANGNGLLTFEELKAGLNVGDTLTQQLINAIDTNGDGQISKLEIIAANTFGLDTLARINASVNSINWTDKAAAVAQFTPLAQANGWTLQQIAAATGYNLSDIQALFSGSPLATGMNAKGFSSTSKTGSTAAAPIGISSGPTDAAWAGGSSGISASRTESILGAVNNLDWNDKNGAATDIWNKAYYLGWTEQDIAAATGYNLSDIDALFKNAGLPAFATGGTHIGGLRIVGENGPELEATGPSRIWNASDTANMLRGGGGDNQALINEVRELRKDVAKSKGEDAPIHLHIMGTDGKTISEIVIRDVKERSRRGEKLIFQAGIVQ